MVSCATSWYRILIHFHIATPLLSSNMSKSLAVQAQDDTNKAFTASSVFLSLRGVLGLRNLHTFKPCSSTEGIMGSSFVIDRSSSSPAPPRGPAPKLSAHARKIICKTSPNRSFLFIISLHICEKYFISMGLRGHRSRFSRSVSTFFSPGKLAWYAEKIDSSSTCSNKNM